MKTIMVVDDSETMRAQLDLTLSHAGYRVVLADGGKAALRAASMQSVDAVITDINMPDINGLDLIGKLRAKDNYAATPIFVLTTEAGPEVKAAGKEVGATAWIIKPFSPESLIRGLTKVLGRS